MEMKWTNNKKYMHAYWQIPVPYDSKLQIIPHSNYHLLAAQQEPYNKACLLKKREQFRRSGH